MNDKCQSALEAAALVLLLALAYIGVAGPVWYALSSNALELTAAQQQKVIEQQSVAIRQLQALAQAKHDTLMALRRDLAKQ